MANSQAMTRAVLDTNVVVSALIWSGKPFALLQAASAGELLLTTSPTLLAELRGVLARRHLANRLERFRSSVEQAIALYTSVAQILDPPTLVSPVSRDPDDDAVLAVAVAARAHLIVSGDGDLLVLGSYLGIPIVTPAEALAMLEP
jgi:putative PIN family toxin of toxin-antitoxin system